MDQAPIIPTTIATINSERFITSPLWQFAACEWSRRILHGRKARAKKDRNAGCAIGAAEVLLRVALEVAGERTVALATGRQECQSCSPRPRAGGGRGRPPLHKPIEPGCRRFLL